MSMALPATVHEERITNQPTYDEPAVIDLHGLSVTFGRRQILKNLRGDLRGRAIGLLGPNGAGKTTLIHTLLRSEEHTSELQSQSNLVCRLLLEKKKKPKEILQ